MLASVDSMASPPLVLPGVLFVGEDERARVVAHTGPAAGWFVPKGTTGWSSEVAVVARDAISDEIKRSTKLVMPEEQIPPARMPLTAQAAQKSPLVAVSSKLAPRLVEAGVRVHTIGVDRVTSSFYYLAEGGDEEPVRIEGDLVAAVGAMLGERADNAAIERVLDGLVDRLLRALSRDRVSELAVELAAALPRAAADGTGLQDVELDAFEAELVKLVGSSEKYTSLAKEIAEKLSDTNERRVEVPLYAEARKVSQGPFDLTVGERKVTLPTYERWVMSQGLTPPATRTSSSTATASVSASPRAATPKPAATTPRPADTKAADKIAADRAAAEKAAARAAEERAARERKAAEERAAAERAAAEKRAAEEKAAAERAAAEKKAAEAKAAEERAAAERAAAENAAAEKKAAEEKAAEEKAAAEKAEKAEKKAAAEREKKAAAAKAPPSEPESKPATRTKRDDSDAEITRLPEKKGSSMTWIALVLLVVAGVVVWQVWFRSH